MAQAEAPGKAGPEHIGQSRLGSVPHPGAGEGVRIGEPLGKGTSKELLQAEAGAAAAGVQARDVCASGEWELGSAGALGEGAEKHAPLESTHKSPRALHCAEGRVSAGECSESNMAAARRHLRVTRPGLQGGWGLTTRREWGSQSRGSVRAAG